MLHIPSARSALLLAGCATVACAPPELDGGVGSPTIEIVYPSAADGSLLLDEDCRFRDLVVVHVENFQLGPVDPERLSPDRGHWHINVIGDSNITMVTDGLPYLRYVAGPFTVASTGETEVGFFVDLRDDLHQIPEGADPDLVEDEVRVTLTEPSSGACQ
ncbi:MAG: hypothetical protein EA397_05975 [Deltaproteobacteria bacterium]|nr:MAG: hypothetical protein EA397_05975 [Deltaproteobacteria bacterium]